MNAVTILGDDNANASAHGITARFNPGQGVLT